MFSLKFDKKSGKELEKLPEDIRERIFSKIIDAKDNPFRFFERLEGRNDYKLRVGDYRVIADINNKDKIIEITKIGHRKEVYK